MYYKIMINENLVNFSVKSPPVHVKYCVDSLNISDKNNMGRKCATFHVVKRKLL